MINEMKQHFQQLRTPTHHHYNIDSYLFYDQMKNHDVCLQFLKEIQSYEICEVINIVWNNKVTKMLMDLINSDCNDIVYESLNLFYRCIDKNHVHKFFEYITFNDLFVLTFTDLRIRTKISKISAKIFVKTISLISPNGINEILYFFQLSTKINLKYMLYNSLKSILEYLKVSKCLPDSFNREIQLKNILNYYLKQNKQPKFILTSLKTIKTLIEDCNIDYKYFDLNRILSLMKVTNNPPIQEHSTIVIKIILLKLKDNFILNHKLYKSISFVIYNSSFSAKIVALESFKLIIDYENDEIKKLILSITNEEMIDFIFSLLDTDDSFSIVGISLILSILNHFDSYPVSQIIFEKLQQQENLNIIEDMINSENSILSSHAALLHQYIVFPE